MLGLEKHQKIALIVYFTLVMFISIRDGLDEAILEGGALLVFLLGILFYRVIAWFASFGFPEYFAKDYGSDNHPGPYAFFLWLLFAIACSYIVFEWRLY